MPLPPPRWGEVPRLGVRDSTAPSQTQLPAGGLQLGAQMAWKVWLLLARPPVTSHRDTLAAAHAGVQVHGGLHPWGCLCLKLHCAPITAQDAPLPHLPPTEASALALGPFCHQGPPCGLPCSRPRAQDSLQGGQRSQHPFVHSFIHPTYECSLSIFQCRVLG